MNDPEYKAFYDKIGLINGWDFGKLQMICEGAEWNFYEEVVQRSKVSDVLLDIGTGGGEHVLSIAASFHAVLGIDASNGMIATAQANLETAKAANVRFRQMSADDLQFPADCFDIVSCRHAPLAAAEIAKVLKPGGVFLTQQVGEADKLNLKAAFGRGQAFGEADGTLKDTYVRELEEWGFSSVRAFDYNAAEYYRRPEDLLFLLKHTPIIPRFGDEDRDFQILNDFIENNRTTKGICTNSRRFLIVAEK